jgi:N-acetylglucosamine-6-sulfatase
LLYRYNFIVTEDIMNGEPAIEGPAGARRTCLGGIVMAMSLAGALAAQGLPTARGAEAPAKPSIVLVLTDDMQASLVAATPNLRSLVAAKGATFTAANDQRPLCGPARAALLTGRYSQNSGVTKNSHVQFYLAGNPGRTIAVTLDAAGYMTGWIGKYINGYPVPGRLTYVPPGWDYWAGRLIGSEFNLPYGYQLNENGVLHTYGRRPADYATDVYFAKALRFIDQAMAADAPFFLVVSTNAPHDPAIPAPRHAHLFLTAKAPRPPSYNEADMSDKPRFVQRASFRPAFTAATDELYRQRLRTMQAVDEGLKAVIAKLAAVGRLDQTYVVFTSDNGLLFGEHRKMRSKGAPYTESLRVPLMIRGPGVRAGLVLDHLVGPADLAPTFADWAGTSPPPASDGRSLAPLLGGHGPSPSAWRKSYPISAEQTVSNIHWPSWIGVVTLNYSYARYATGERELYDNRADPYQLDNLIGSAPSDLVASLDKRAVALSKCKAQQCAAIEASPIGP